MPAADITINEIKALEDRRYRAMIDGDTAVLDALCSDDLIYTHSKGDHDDKRSYLHKVGSGKSTMLYGSLECLLAALVLCYFFCQQAARLGGKEEERGCIFRCPGHDSGPSPIS